MLFTDYLLFLWNGMFISVKVMGGFIDFLSENVVWLVPVAVAFISGIFGIIKLRMGRKAAVSQKAKAGDGSNIIQIGGDCHAGKTRG